MKRLIASLFLLAPLLAPGACAQDAMQIEYFENGQYEEAAFAVSDAKSADHLAFSARALLAKGMCGTSQPATDLLDKAEKYAREALASEPDHVEARLQLAIALSLKARPLSTRAAMKAGYGEEAKTLADAALTSNPNNPYGHGFMAVWNIEVVRRGGAIGSRLMGASVKQGRKHYNRASALSPDDASIHWQYARALAALNPRKYRKDIDAALSRALNAPAEDHLERVMSSRAAQLQQLLQAQPRKIVKSWAIDML